MQGIPGEQGSQNTGVLNFRFAMAEKNAKVYYGSLEMELFSKKSGTYNKLINFSNLIVLIVTKYANLSG